MHSGASSIYMAMYTAHDRGLIKQCIFLWIYSSNIQPLKFNKSVVQKQLIQPLDLRTLWIVYSTSSMHNEDASMTLIPVAYLSGDVCIYERGQNLRIWHG